VALDRIERGRSWPVMVHMGGRISAFARRLLQPRKLWTGIAVLGIVLAGYLLLGGGDKPNDFFSLDGATTPATAGHVDTTVARMMQPLPEAPFQRALENARRQLGERKLTAPSDDNARASVIEAWRIDPSSREVRDVLGQVTAALGSEAVRGVRERNDARAREYIVSIRQLGEQTGTATSASQREALKDAGKAFEARMREDESHFDRTAARTTTTLAQDFGLPAKQLSRLSARADAIPKPGQKVPGDASGAVISDGGIAVARQAVKVGEYRRFAAATGRASALCREKASLLRVLKPRDWKQPGFTQTDNDPVVCVSFADAEAYARWRSQQTGHRYRLPDAAESQQLTAGTTARAVSLWSKACSLNCDRHQALGSSWRSNRSNRPLLSNRGYDDVGFRLVREL
jgi:hypothetical protein